MQLVLFYLHCNKPMWGHGVYRGRKRYRCSKCGHMDIDGKLLRHKRVIGDLSTVNGRVTIYLGPDDPMTNSDGWQYLARVIVMIEIGRVLRADEHVDHKDGDMTNNDVRNLRLLLDIEHGRHHYYTPSRYVVLGEWVEDELKSGKFVEYNEPKEIST